MQIEIRPTQNGIILSVDDGDDYCYQETYDGEKDYESFADFLRIINENYGPMESRYAEKRVYVTVGHGDKYECPNKPCEYCPD